MRRFSVMEENKINVKALTLIALAALALCVIMGALVFIFGRQAETTVFPPKTDDGIVTYCRKDNVTSDSFTEQTTLTLTNDGRFSLSFSMLYSSSCKGTYIINDNKLTLNTDDDAYHFTFLIKDDGKTLVFDGENSSEWKWYPEMNDGTELELSPEREKVYSYLFQDRRDPSLYPVARLMFTDDGSYTMTFLASREYSETGTYTVKDGKLTMNTDDGEYYFTFLIEDDGKTLILDGENSSEWKWYPTVKDGTEFAVLGDPAPTWCK